MKNVVENLRGRHGGDFARLVSTHAVADSVDPVIIIQMEVVLIP